MRYHEVLPLCGVYRPAINLSAHTWGVTGQGRAEKWKLCVFVCTNGLLLCQCQTHFYRYNSLTASTLRLPLSPGFTFCFKCMPLMDITQLGLPWVMCARSGLWREKLFISHHMPLPPRGRQPGLPHPLLQRYCPAIRRTSSICRLRMAWKRWWNI